MLIERDGHGLPEVFIQTGKRVVKGNELTVTIGGQLTLKDHVHRYPLDDSAIHQLHDPGWPGERADDVRDLRIRRRDAANLFLRDWARSPERLHHCRRGWAHHQRVEKGQKVELNLCGPLKEKLRSLPERVAESGKASRSNLLMRGATVYITGRSLEDMEYISGKGLALQCDHRQDEQVQAAFSPDSW